MKYVNPIEGVNYTRAKKIESQAEHHQSALTDHAALRNYLLNGG